LEKEEQRTVHIWCQFPLNCLPKQIKDWYLDVINQKDYNIETFGTDSDLWVRFKIFEKNHSFILNIINLNWYNLTFCLHPELPKNHFSSGPFIEINGHQVSRDGIEINDSFPVDGGHCRFEAFKNERYSFYLRPISF